MRRGAMGRRKSGNIRRENYSFWLSFADLMSALLLVFVLILFYSIYQYFDMLEITTAEQMRQSGLLSQQIAETEAQKTEAEQQKQQNAEAQAKLTESEKALIGEQAKLLLAQQAQGEAERTLAERQKDLEDALALLQMQQTDLDTARQLLETQQGKLQDQQVRLDELVGVRAKIVKSLADALARANVKANVDKTGSIALDASVLFDLGKSELKEEGKRVLDQFVPVYLDVLMSGENQDNISEIIIEGHTDSQGTYMNNLRLSQERALSVMQYILSDENSHISPQMKTRLRQIGTANGRSFSNLKTSPATGQEDAEASRRVEFKFRMQDEQMIQSMREILDSMD